MKNILKIQRFNVIARNEAIHNLLDCFTLRVCNDARYVIVALTLLWGVGGLYGCNWLDVIPDNLPTIDDAFSNKATAEKSLFSCYRYLPNPLRLLTYPTYLANRDEFEFGTQSRAFYEPAYSIAIGEQNTSEPIMNFWPGMYQAIRTCNIFLEGIHQPKDISEYERKRWIAEVKFLKAYYHFFLLQLYGPVPLIKENKPLSATPDEVRVFREPVDECIAYIVQLIDETLPDLPRTINSPTDENGRITQTIALAVKAKVLVWGASSLFNGNHSYQKWKDEKREGILLVSDTYSREKWEKAAEAIWEAIETCHREGHQLYRYNKASMPQTFNMNDSLTLTMNTRKAITDKWNLGIVWTSASLRGGWWANGVWDLNDMQRTLFPSIYQPDVDLAVSRGLASFNMAELFYTKNGIPIDEDNDWDYTGRYTLRTSTPEAGNGHYIALEQQTASLNFDREPRFYANLGFDRGYFELSSTTTNGGASFSTYLRLRKSEPGYSVAYNRTGYYVKKLIAFESKGDPYEGYDYRFPLLRLADLYLLYSEALNEVKEKPDDEVYKWIDEVRDVVGLEGVIKSWEKSKYPNRPKDKDEMRKIIQQERLIELAFEGQRFWDMRRWKLAESSRTYIPVGWNYNGETPEEYYTVIKVGEGVKFTEKDYLWPIRNSDLRINPNLVQSWGW